MTSPERRQRSDRTAAEPRRFLDRLHAGQSTLMMAIRSGRTTDIVQIAKSTGHDCVLLDLEHSNMALDTVSALCVAADSLEMTALVRVPEREYGMIGRVLDGGAHGIVVPGVESAEQAGDIARACRFPPQGQRSQTAMGPQLHSDAGFHHHRAALDVDTPQQTGAAGRDMGIGPA
jgi:2-keto-3-deoxy-L-rhamnonate aldolase RhmA